MQVRVSELVVHGFDVHDMQTVMFYMCKRIRKGFACCKSTYSDASGLRVLSE